MVTSQLKLTFFDVDNKKQIKTFNILSNCTNQQIVDFARVIANLIEDWQT